MTTRYSCALNGVSLDALDERIHITDVTELPPKQRVATAARPGDGLHLLSRVRESLTVRVQFLIHSSDTLHRRQVMQKIQQWAEHGGVLTIGDRPGQQLTVVCDGTPAISALSWLDEMSIDFTAYATPYWEAVIPTEATTSDNAYMTVPGTADYAPVSVTIRNEGEAPLTTLTLVVYNTAMSFPALDLDPGYEMTLAVEDDRLRVTRYGENILISRTPESADLLLAPCGKEFRAYVSANQHVSVTFSVRGRYL